ncbi:MAG: CAP domain-containing protein [Chamaesiphon sp.]|nr:CAP domain-containing protein [Chamaesiphon sp.]
MKYHFLGTFGALATVIGIAATTVRADVSFSIPSGADSGQESPPSTAGSTPNQANRNLQSTRTPAMNSSELTTYNLVNRYRQSRNLPPLVADPAISAQAKAHSEEMARSSTMSHDGFNQRADSVSKTIVYRSAAENVAFNAGHGQPELVAVKGWIASPGHQRNMRGQYDLTGIGVAQNAKGEYYFTQIFIRKAWYVKDAD